LVHADTWVADVDGKLVRASTGHRLWVDNAWVKIETIGVEAEATTVVQLMVDEAHTYISDGILSHNLKVDSPE
jgi:intein/homing endonuclease